MRESMRRSMDAEAMRLQREIEALKDIAQSCLDDRAGETLMVTFLRSASSYKAMRLQLEASIKESSDVH